jgi:hypothetical protein
LILPSITNQVHSHQQILLLAVIVEPIISIINKIEAILVNTPIIKALPPITSSKPIGRAIAAGNPTILAKKSSVPATFESLGKP